MTLEKLIKLKETRKLTNQQISDLSGVPLSTVTRIFNGQTDNPNFQTIADIVMSMDGSLDELLGLEKQYEDKDTDKDKLILLYQEILKTKNKYIKFLVALLTTIMAVFLILIIVDVLCGKIGYIRY